MWSGAEVGRGTTELLCSGSELACPPGVPLALLLYPAEMERPRCWCVACVLGSGCPNCVGVPWNGLRLWLPLSQLGCAARVCASGGTIRAGSYLEIFYDLRDMLPVVILKNVLADGKDISIRTSPC